MHLQARVRSERYPWQLTGVPHVAESAWRFPDVGHVLWVGFLKMAFPTDVRGSNIRANDIALAGGLENRQYFHFPAEKVTRERNVFIFRRRCSSESVFPGWSRGKSLDCEHWFN
jgi:hypothetical protein